MSKEKNQVIGIEINELMDLIRVTVRNEIETCLQDCRFGTEFKEEVLNRKQVAELFKVTPEKITDGYNNKEIPGRKVGREYFFLKSQIIGMFKKGKQ